MAGWLSIDGCVQKNDRSKILEKMQDTLVRLSGGGRKRERERERGERGYENGLCKN